MLKQLVVIKYDHDILAIPSAITTNEVITSSGYNICHNLQAITSAQIKLLQLVVETSTTPIGINICLGISHAIL